MEVEEEDVDVMDVDDDTAAVTADGTDPVDDDCAACSLLRRNACEHTPYVRNALVIS